MVINDKDFYGLSISELKHLETSLVPYWEADKDIDEMLLDVAKYLMVGASLDEMPKYVFTKTSVEICKKIKITNNTVDLIEPQDPIMDGEKLTNEWGLISLNKEFYIYAVISNALFVIHIMINPDGNIGYDVWKMSIGFKGADYGLTDTVKEFLKLLVYLRYTDPDIKIIESGKKYGSKKKGFYNTTLSSITIVDSSWNMISIRTEGFSVTGHFRLQPTGLGRRQRSLIWIDPFEKEGYIRKNKSGN